MFEPDFEGCDFCGFPRESHPVESAVRGDDETFCEEFVGGAS